MATQLVSSRGVALSRCVACSTETFADSYWSRSPLLSRADELTADFADLFSPAAVDELASERGLRTPFIRMAKDGVVQSAGSFTRGGGAGAAIADQAADDKITSAMADGTTLVLQGLHRTWPPLVRFGSLLAAELGHPVQINAYVTPPQSQGFAPHHDVHDVFVLQIAGSKHWTIHEPVVSDPLDNQPFSSFKQAISERVGERPLIDTTLEPGDALYLPRGVIHSAEALGETSIHLTVGIHPITRTLLSRLIFDELQSEPEIRRSLPMGVDLSDPDTLAPHVHATIDVLRAALDTVSEAKIADRVAADLMQRTRPEPIKPLTQLNALDTLTPDTQLCCRGSLRLQIRTVNDEAVELVFLDRTLSLPAVTTAAINLISDGEVFTPSELPGLVNEEQLVLTRRLLREGLIIPA